MAVETRWWHVEGEKVVCTLCPRECHIPRGSRGFCFVRANVDGRLELTTDGRSSGFCIDPIEKKPLNHFLPGTPVLSFGTAGCNLGCKFCQNWDISKSREMDRLADTATPSAIIEAAKQSQCRSVAFTYNDPVIWAEYAIEIAKIARREDIKTVAVTAGYITPDARKEFYRWIDAANVDLKAFTETFYRRLTQTHLEPVLETLEYLKHETDVWFEITNLIIPGENDSPQETKEMCQWIVEHLGDEVPVHFTAFHPDFKMLDKPRTPHETLIGARQIALDCGIKYAYVGNVHDLERQSTYCPDCGQVLIARDWYELGRYNLDGHRCNQCGYTIRGVFEADAGRWGRKRVPVTIEKSADDTVTVAPRSPTLRPWNPYSAPKRRGEKAKTRASVGQLAAGAGALTNGPVEPPRIDFDETQVGAILRYMRDVVEAAVKESSEQATLDRDIGQSPAFGLFVTLRRLSTLRACRGRWGGTQPSKLGELITRVAADTARLDHRFPSIAPHELPCLAIDVSLMFNPQNMTATGEDRIHRVEVGKHGLVIAHPRGRGLLLPHVATEGHWDAKTFLDGVCRKAGLPPDCWRRDSEASLATFEARRLTSDPPTPDLDPMRVKGQRLQELISAANRMLQEQPVGDVDPTLSAQHAHELGLCMKTGNGVNTTAIGVGQSLIELARVAVNSLKDLAARNKTKIDPIKTLTLLWQPIQLRAEDYPQRHLSLANHAVLARRDGPWALVVPGRGRQSDPVGSVLSNLQVTKEDWQTSDKIRVTAFKSLVFEAHQAPANNASNVRPAARAGQFYPGDVEQMHQSIDEYLEVGRRDANGQKPQHRRAVMLPHAGWIYCGQTIGKTLALTEISDTVIIIGPKHTPYGENWSVTSHSHWKIPGASVPVATDLAKQLLERVPNLRCESEAHRAEHGSEVLIPFLLRLNRNLRVLPIVIGRADYEQTEPLARALAEVVGGQDAPLLVISSDMNHFAAEPENRRLDHMALDAMCTGDPRQLYDTCVEHEISMCGFIPACIIMQTLLAQSESLTPQLVDYCNSAQTTGDTSRVVGYAGVLLD